LPLKPGRYRARIVAKDASGLKSKQRVLTFKIVPRVTVLPLRALAACRRGSGRRESNPY